MKQNKAGMLAQTLAICVLLSVISTTVFSTIEISASDPPIWTLDPMSSSAVVPTMYWESNGTGIANTTRTEGGSEDAVSMISDGQGGCFIAWLYNDPVTGDDIYAQHMDVFGNALWGGNGTPVCRAEFEQYNPKIVSDGNGGIIVAWADNRNNDWDENIYAQRISAEGNALWEGNGTIVSNADSTQNYINMVSDNHGGAIIVWEDDRGSDDDIYAQRINGNGISLWTANGTLISLEGDEDDNPNVYMNDADDVFIAWVTYNKDEEHIFSQKLNLLGANQWAVGGVQVKKALDNGLDIIIPKIIDDTAGGIIVGWMEENSDWDLMIYMNRISATGTRLWGTKGVILSSESNDVTFDIISDGLGGYYATFIDDYGHQVVNHYSLNGHDDWEESVRIDSGESVSWPTKLVSDLKGGVIITWSENVGAANWRIFTQRINATGAAQWLSGANEISNITNNDRFIYGAVSDTAGGIIVAFFDVRNGNTDIYAQRIKEFTAPLAPILTVNTATTPTGAITLDWNDVIDANNFTVYRSTQPIVAITGGLSVIANGITASTCGDALSTYGTYYYAVVARNSEGNSALSNNQKVTYPDPNADNEKPDDGTTPTEPEGISPVGIIVSLVLGLVALGVIVGYVFIKNRGVNEKYLKLLKR
jgi:hypothetical protein